MTEISRRTVLGGVIATGVAAHLRPASAAAAALPPLTIPAIREWTAGTGLYQYGGRIVVGDSRLSATASTVSDDLLALTGSRPAVVQSSQPMPGDVYLALADDAQLGDEGYRMIVSDVIRIEAPTARGCFYGTRTLLQLLRKATTIPAGTIRDWPSYPERGLLIANEARRLPLRWWQEQIRELAFLKLNLLYFYVGYPNAPLADLKAVAEFAARYHVTVVPQLNMPGHMENIAGRPYLHGNPDRLQSLDLADPAGFDFAAGKLESLLPEFATPYWHLGADEYMIGGKYSNYPQLLASARQLLGATATELDLVYSFVNRCNTTVRGLGKSMRIWNDGLYRSPLVTVDKNVTIEHWVGYGRTASDLLADGYKLQNCHLKQLYYDVGGESVLDPAVIYDTFRVGAFHGSSVPDTHPGLLGAKLHVWIFTGSPIPNSEIAGKLHAPLRSLAQRTWGTPKPFPTYGGFAPLIASTGHAPGNEGWLAETPGLAGRAFVKGPEQHVLTAVAAGGVRHWSYSDATGVVADSWAGPVLKGQPIGFQHGEEHHVFGSATDGSLAHWKWTPGDVGAPHLDNWQAGPGSLTSAPAALAYFDQQHVFHRNAAGGLTHRFYDRSSGTIGVEDWGGALEGAPNAFVWNDEQHVFGRGPDGSLRHWWYTLQQTTTPQRDTWTAPNTVASGISGLAYADQQHVYFRRTDGRLGHAYYDQSSNSVAAETWGGELAGDPVAYVWRDEQHVFGRGPDNSLRHWFYAPTQTVSPARDTWTPANTLVGDPTGYAVGDQQHVFYQAASALGHRYWDTSEQRIVTDDWRN